jgi:GT2 family glycosyltransferase
VTPLSRRVGISIPTRDRWDDLAVTLDNLRQHGYSDLETIVIDDGSATPMPTGFAERFPWVRFIRSDRPEGVCAQRNRIARQLSTPLILSLDDDSYPVAGDLESACEWLEQRPKVFALCFQIIFRQEKPPEDFASRPPFPVRDFIGCAALIRRDVFLSLNGYEEGFIFMAEEPEVCLRAMQEGYEIDAYPGVIVQHNLSPVRRNRAKRTELLLRRESLVALAFYPFPQSFRRALTCVPGYFFKNPEFRPYLFPMLVGVARGLADYFSGRFPRKRLSRDQFAAWKSVPIAPSVLMGLQAAAAKDYFP